MTQPVSVEVEILEHARGLDLPRFETEGSAGADVRAAVEKPLTMGPGETAKVPTGLRVAIPRGFEIQVRPRSGLAARNGVTILNAPGTIDSDYRGEVQILLINFGKEPFVIERGLRIAQLVMNRIEQIEWKPVTAVAETARGDGGFGSTGI